MSESTQVINLRSIVLKTSIIFLTLTLVWAAAAGHIVMFSKVLTVPIAIILAISIARTKNFFRDWSIFLSAVMLFDSIRGLIYILNTAMGRKPYYLSVMHFDYLLFDGKLPSDRLQHWLGASAIPDTLDRFAALMYGSHFLFFLLLGFFVWHFYNRYFWQFCCAMTLMMYAGLVCYFLFPTAPPWMISQNLNMPQVYNVIATMYSAATPTLYTTFDSNPVASMPSLHAAFSFLCLLIATHHFRWRGFLIVFPYFLGIIFSTLYTPEHYVLDLVAGCLLSTASYYVVYKSNLVSTLENSYRQFHEKSLGNIFSKAAIIILLAQLISIWCYLYVANHSATSIS